MHRHEVVRWGAAGQRAQQAAARRLQRLRLQQCLSAWRAAVGLRAEKQAALAVAGDLRRQGLQRRALGGWCYIAWFQQAARDAVGGKQLQLQAAALQAWRQHAALAGARRALLADLSETAAARLAARALYGWRAHVEGRQARALQEEHDR